MRPALIALPLLLAAGAATAQDAAGLANLAACRSAEGTVELAFTYTGGACEATDPATAVVQGSAALVTVPTRSTAEVCTMQALDIDVAQSVAIDPAVTALEVELLNPEGAVAATGSVDVEPACAES